MADAMETVGRDETGEATTERVGPFMLTVASSEPSPDSEQRWARRAEVLTGWLVAEWHRKQAHDDGAVIDDLGRSDEADEIRRQDLN